MLYKQATIFIVDSGERLLGVIVNSSYREHRGDIEAAINYKCKYVYESDANKEAHMLYWWAVAPNVVVPVLDQDRRILYACTQERHYRLKDDTTGWETEKLAETYEKYREKGHKVKIITDLDLSGYDGMEDAVTTVSRIDGSCSDFVFLVSFKETFLFDGVIEKLTELNLKYIACGNSRAANRFAVYEHLHVPVVDYCSLDRNAWDTLREIANDKGFYYDSLDMEQICQVISAAGSLEGDYLEIGVYRGDSAEVACRYMSRSRIKKRIFLMDTYEGFTYEDAFRSSDMLWQNTHRDTSLDLVRYRLREYDNVTFVQGNIIQDPLDPRIGMLSVCNIDVDLYDSVYAALTKVKDRMVRSGIIICEDFGHMPYLAGANYAVKKFLRENPDDFTAIYMASGQMLLIRR